METESGEATSVCRFPNFSATCDDNARYLHIGYSTEARVYDSITGHLAYMRSHSKVSRIVLFPLCLEPGPLYRHDLDADHAGPDMAIGYLHLAEVQVGQRQLGPLVGAMASNRTSTTCMLAIPTDEYTSCG